MLDTAGAADPFLIASWLHRLLHLSAGTNTSAMVLAYIHLLMSLVSC